jgi:hypothetical protein
MKTLTPTQEHRLAMMAQFIRGFLFAVILLAGVDCAQAQQSQAGRSSPPASGYSFLEETPGDTELVETQDERTIEYLFRPKFEDLARNDVIRFRNILKYGITDKLEARARFEFYTGNPVRDSWNTDVSNAGIGIKYKFDEWPGFANIKSATGFDFDFPIGSPSSRFTTGYAAVSPYIVFSRPLDRNPSVHTFANLGLSFFTNPPFREIPSDDRPDHRLDVTTGVIYYYSRTLSLTGELKYQTTEIAGGGENKVFLTPGVSWNIPRNYTEFLRIPGSMLVAVGVEVPLTSEDENYSTFAKLKWNFDVGRFLSERFRKTEQQEKKPRTE